MTAYPYIWKGERCSLHAKPKSLEWTYPRSKVCQIELESRPGILLVVPRSEVAYNDLNHCYACGRDESEALSTYHYEPVLIDGMLIVKFFCRAACQPSEATS